MRTRFIQNVLILSRNIFKKISSLFLRIHFSIKKKQKPKSVITICNKKQTKSKGQLQILMRKTSIPVVFFISITEGKTSSVLTMFEIAAIFSESK